LVKLTVDRVIDRFTIMARTRGVLSAVGDMKSGRLAITRVMSGRPLRNPGTPVDHISFLPKVLPLEVRMAIKLRNTS
jgi:hypothetical protein